MHLRQKTRWLKLGAWLTILLTVVSCSFLGYSVASDSGDSTVEVTRIVRETVIVNNPVEPVVVEVTRRVEVTR
ncbi:MAG TPA: hypothetical protein G4O08_07915 [Anaerolineae bacterium]|nr:hypothetical protein [Anaerolineae bacterium]